MMEGVRGGQTIEMSDPTAEQGNPPVRVGIMHDGVGQPVQRHADADRDEGGETGDIESGSHANTDRTAEQQGIRVVGFPSDGCQSVVAAVQTCTNSVHDEAMRQIGDRLHHHERHHHKHERHADDLSQGILLFVLTARYAARRWRDIVRRASAWSRKDIRLFWSKPAPPPAAPPPPTPPPAPAPKKSRRWGLWLIISVIGLSVASAGCKDRRLLDGTGTTTTTKSTAKKPTRGTGATTAPPLVSTFAPIATAAPVQTAEYVIVAGDTVFGVAKKFNLSVAALLAANNLTDANKVQVGQKLKVPVAAGTTPTAVPVKTTQAGAPGTGTFPPVTVADDSPRTSIVTITVVVNLPKTTKP